jgi:hypothetical protein
MPLAVSFNDDKVDLPLRGEHDNLLAHLLLKEAPRLSHTRLTHTRLTERNCPLVRHRTAGRPSAKSAADGFQPRLAARTGRG